MVTNQLKTWNILEFDISSEKSSKFFTFINCYIQGCHGTGQVSFFGKSEKVRPSQDFCGQNGNKSVFLGQNGKKSVFVGRNNKMSDFVSSNLQNSLISKAFKW